MIRGARVVRDGQTLTVYANRWFALLCVLIGVAFIVGGATSFGRGSTGLKAGFFIIAGSCCVLAALRVVLSPKPLLVVSADGISSPFYNTAETVDWKRIAIVEPRSKLSARTFSVRLWYDLARPRIGTDPWLDIPSLALPTRTTTLVREVLTPPPGGMITGPRQAHGC